ncbi:hypothetical protein JG688_00016674 [Phytophthora aleatoria]|uniref:Uncharacterized protein n=1 Tax=Phytophthora aleatoria TaxID=2496075 RepID=A0A8J5IFA5_9STRA|nr:hypothetical protein JG688_00016674 [Phytophthora aleatoria]
MLPPSSSDARMPKQSLDFMVSSLAVLLNQHLWSHTTIELKRTLGHEYMNGFNYEIMATFKCNHDVQILLGGRDVIDRIHYCCKYVTKSQKRVAALVYNMTNRQEIAGPLATLYLYRGSCCYSSTGCVTLPLGEVLRQLMKSEDYCCALVNERADETVTNFRAVSFLDDYVFRPTKLQDINLYEFTMHHFRRNFEKTTVYSSFS